MKIQSGRSGTPYKAPGARKNMAEGGTAKRQVKLRKDGKLSDLKGKKADKIRAAAKAGETGEIKTGFLGLGKRYKIVQPEKKAATPSRTKKKASPGDVRPPTKPKDPRSDVKVTKRSLGRGGKPSPRLDKKGEGPAKRTKNPHPPKSTVKPKPKSTRATQSDRAEYRRADEMREVTRTVGATTKSLGTRMGKGKKSGASDAQKRTGAYSEYQLRKRAGGAQKAKTRAGTSRVDVDKIKTIGGKKDKRAGRKSGSGKG